MKKFSFWTSIVCALIFMFLFYDRAAGINQALFAWICVILSWLWTQGEKRSALFIGLMISTILLGIAVTWHGAWWSRVLLIGSAGLMAGTVAMPRVTWFSVIIPNFLLSITSTQSRFFKRPVGGGRKPMKTGFWSLFLIYLVPLGLVVMFIIFYSKSNPVFEHYTQNFTDWVYNWGQYIKFGAVFTFILGLLITNLFLFAEPRSIFATQWENRILTVKKGREKSRFYGLYQGLRHEYASAFFLMSVLNLLLFLLNLADIRVVWIGFTWSGQLLKSFVHEGTWYLIISILISVFAILFYFRGNLNFFHKSPRLRLLAYIWLGQNAFLAISVMLRNFHYVEYYGLAYLRIGVFFFLMAIFGGLFMVWLKLRYTHSTIHWVNHTAWLALGTMVFSGLFDWASIIVRYNLAHYKRSYVHNEFLITLPDRVLPILSEYSDKWEEIRQAQLQLGFGYHPEVDGEPIKTVVDRRVRYFLTEYRSRRWQEWCYADRAAYQRYTTR